MTHEIKQRVTYSERMVHYQHGWGNGYVGVPQGHPWFELNYMDIEADVHGELTYGQLENDGLYWVGFDTAHGWETEENWPKSRVAEETKKLYKQAVDAIKEKNQ